MTTNFLEGRNLLTQYCVAHVRQDRNPTDQQSAYAFNSILETGQTGNPRAEPQAEPGVASYSCFFPNPFALGGWVDTTPGRFANGKGEGVMISQLTP